MSKCLNVLSNQYYFRKEEHFMENEQMFKRTVKPVLDVKDKPKPAQWAF